MTIDYAVRADRIVKNYGRKRALDGVSISVRRGQVHVLLGRNGSGKTTLAKVLAGMIRPDEGTLSGEGISASAVSSEFRGRVGFLFDTSAHWEELTGRENAWFFARSFGLGPASATERVQGLLEQLSLEKVADDRVSTYSFGMRRKLALLEALVHAPSLIVLDEPSIGLDHEARAKLYSALRSRAASGSAVLVATNDTNEARHIADHVHLMEGGRILVSGAPDELIRRLDGDVIIRIETSTPPMLDSAKNLPGVKAIEAADVDGRTIVNVMTKAADEVRVLDSLLTAFSESGTRIEKIDLRRPGLGDVFMEYLGGEDGEAR